MLGLPKEMEKLPKIIGIAVIEPCQGSDQKTDELFGVKRFSSYLRASIFLSELYH